MCSGPHPRVRQSGINHLVFPADGDPRPSRDDRSAPPRRLWQQGRRDGSDDRDRPDGHHRHGEQPGARGCGDRSGRRQSASTDVSLLTDVRAAAHEGYDRVVFEFRNGRRATTCATSSGRSHADGSGDEVAVDGRRSAGRADGACARRRPDRQESAPLTYPARSASRPTRPPSPSSSARAASRPSSRGRSASTRGGRSASRGSRARRGS